MPSGATAVVRTPRQKLDRASRELIENAADWAAAQRDLPVRLRESLRVEVSPAFRVGARRASRLAIGYARLSFWRARRMRGRAFRRSLLLSVAILATAACSLVSGGGEPAGTSEPPVAPAISPAAPDLSKVDKPAKVTGPWAYVLPVDYGVRADKSGMGHFRAPRFHGEHNGIDLLAPVGTRVFAACAGRAMAGASPSFGRWVHLICPVPEQVVAKGHPYASFFYAHLNEVELPHNEWVEVEKAQDIGAVGKSGNADDPKVQPHLHLELILQKNRRAAMDERHLGKDQSMVPAAKQFLAGLQGNCLSPHGFEPKSGALRRARRFDPFVALTCLSADKPAFRPAPEPLEWASHSWSKFYDAKKFNVDRGPDRLLVAGR